MPSSRGRRAAERKAAAARRRRTIAATAAAAVIAAAAAAYRSAGGDEGRAPLPHANREGSDVLPGRDDRLRVRDEPESYRVTYRVDTYSGGDRVTTRDELAIRRPFEGRTRKLAGPDQDDDVRSAQIGTLGRLYVPSTSTSDEVLLETGPSLAPSDLRLSPVLDDVLAAGQAQEREWRTVLGRPCRVIRFGGPITSGTVAPTLDATAEYSDACLSEHGIVLEEVWVESGRVRRRRVATEIQLQPRLPPATFAVGDVQPTPVEEGGGSFRAVDITSAYPAPFWVLDEPPLGEHAGRWAVVSPAGGDPKDEETEQRRLGYVVDVWTDGVDVVSVEQGSTAGGVRAFDLGNGPRITVPDLGEGEIVLDLRMSEIRFVRDGGYFLRVRGTAGRGRLEQIARQLRRTDGGSGLIYLEE